MYSCGINNCRHTTQTLGAMLDHEHEHVINQMGDTITALRTENAALTARVKELEEALGNLLKSHVRLVESGDGGFWDVETETEVIEARAALRGEA